MHTEIVAEWNLQTKMEIILAVLCKIKSFATQHKLWIPTSTLSKYMGSKMIASQFWYSARVSTSNNTVVGIKTPILRREEIRYKRESRGLTPFEPDFDLLLVWFETDDFSFDCFFAVPVTTSKIVGRSLIIVNRRFLHQDLHSITDWYINQA